MKASVELKNQPEHGAPDSWLEIVRRQVSSLNFGVVQIVVHGSRVDQIERTEKLRLENPIALSNPAD